ncbi:MAG: gamma-glutamyltransferase family protein [Rubrivivax sp.]|nr:gamma-glutamyltransferase family protein [Rubrivivax sp.]
MPLLREGDNALDPTITAFVLGVVKPQSRVQLNAAGQVELKLKMPWRDGPTHRISWVRLLKRVFCSDIT